MSIYKDRAVAIEDLDFMIESIQTAMNGRARKGPARRASTTVRFCS